MQLGFYFDQTRCTGCDTCTIACKDWNEYDLGAEPANWRWVEEREEGVYPNPFVSYMALSCLHCAQPSCVDACPVSAISKRPEGGIVMVNRNECLGKDQCGECRAACPYDAPRFGSEEDAKMQKCDFCIDRWEEAKLPVSVAGCPMRALDAGDIEELRRKYGSGKEAPGFKYATIEMPSIVIKAKEQR